MSTMYYELEGNKTWIFHTILLPISTTVNSENAILPQAVFGFLKNIVGIKYYNVVARISAKFSRSTGYNCNCEDLHADFSNAVSQRILIFHYPLW